MPHSLDAERSVLGAVMVDNEALEVATAVVSAEMFYRDAHRRIWRRMVALSDKREPIDYRTLSEALVASGELEDVGGPVYVGGLVDGVPRATNVDAYARIVKEKHTLRETIKGATHILEMAMTGAEAADEVIDRAEKIVMALGRSAVSGEFVLAADWATELQGAIEHNCQNKRLITGVPTSLPKLDQYTRGFQRADLIFIGARPSVGKTSLMMQMASHASDHVMTGIVSLEMKRREVGMRMVATEARVDLFKIQTGYLSAAEQLAVFRALERIRAKRLAIDDASGLTDSQLRAKVRRLAVRHGLGIVFVDYMQLLRGSEKSENRNQEISRMSAGLKDLAKELDIPVVLLSQLSRDNVKANRRPQMSDLRDSGSLEQDADMVLLLHRPKQDEGSRYADGEEAELLIEKQRNGPTAMVPLMWMGAQVRFGERELQRESA
jgi:replicative DNA helicase